MLGIGDVCCSGWLGRAVLLPSVPVGDNTVHPQGITRSKQQDGARQIARL